MKTICLVVSAFLLIGCGGNEGVTTDPNDPLPGLTAIEVTPAATTVEIADLAVTETIELQATGHFEDGATRDITAEVDWGVDNAAPGSFVASGKWQSSNRAGGEVQVEATSAGLSGTATITVMFRPTIEDPTTPPPAGADDLFDPATPVVRGDATSSPRIVYPAHEVMFPINVYRIMFQYDQGTGTDVYRIRFESPVLDMNIYTTGDRWQADETTWDFLALSNAGSKVSMTVAGVNSADPSTIYESAPIDIYFSRSAVEGAIYYWSTSSEGVMKGVLSEPAPEKFYTQPPDTTCVACHTVSRDGTRLAAGYGGETLQEVTIPEREVVIPESRNYAMGWSTFSPDSSRLLISNQGSLQLLDSNTGDPVGLDNGLVDLGGYKATHPDWSPLGDFVAMAVCPDPKNKDANNCSIARIAYDSGSWGSVEILVQATGVDNNFFPKYSPDGRWIAYVYAPDKSKDQPEAELRIIPAQGGEPILLARATTRVGPDDGVLSTGSSMPTWAPSTHPGTQWLAFSSIRDYGKILVGDKADQLWVVALDLERASQGQDPSYAAFWLPLQDAFERNHRAFWAHDVEQPCTGSVEVCDGFDNDCDGVVDEDCQACQPSETCGDGVDNNCDGQIDEGCIG